ncbi:ArsA family ATPase [Streptomyces sp. RB6PN25]|uniref:ArsA family ATPase n=1 Tax=Streptomyces humicola TaxID=2953240 RepID=A0ABT1PV87_9ACTN|nr:ArsA-related P-loop ATPase [Streptomyces humicola]MCQ4081570.1 ArsA family ATPase [Streptomyces humicola]
MPPRIVLVTGLGGAGRSTAAAATAVAAARSGARTVLVTEKGPAPCDDVPGLTITRVDGGHAFRARAHAFQARLGSVLDLLGAEPLDAEEFTELPGARSFALLHALGEAAAGRADTVVADLPPLPQAVTLLALPEQLRRYLARLLPPERQAARALRPVLAQLAGVPMPAQWLYEAAARWDVELAAVQGLVESAATTVRLVVEPGPHAAERLRDARTGLALFGHRVECVLANRILPTGSADPFLAGLSGGQQEHLKALNDEFGTGRTSGTEVCELPHLGHAPHGADDLAALGVPAPAPVPDGRGPAARPWSVEDRLGTEGHLLWRLPLPGTTRDRLDLVRRGDELVVDAASFRRIIPLTSALRRCTVSGAALRDGALLVRFTPDPELWPADRAPKP